MSERITNVNVIRQEKMNQVIEPVLLQINTYVRLIFGAEVEVSLVDNQSSVRKYVFMIKAPEHKT